MKRFLFTASLLIVILLTSCGEDPELVKKHGEQQAEIAKLSGELALMKERLKSLPEDQSAELKKNRAEVDKLESERSRLANEAATLELKKKELLQQFEDYKKKYSIR